MIESPRVDGTGEEEKGAESKARESATEKGFSGKRRECLFAAITIAVVGQGGMRYYAVKRLSSALTRYVAREGENFMFWKEHLP